MTQTPANTTQHQYAAEIAIEAEVTKQEISEYGDLKYRLNSQTFRGHAPGTLLFQGFYGAYDTKRRVYAGSYRFLNLAKTSSHRSQSTPSSGEADFNQLPGLKAEGETSESSAEVEVSAAPEEAPAESAEPLAETSTPRRSRRKTTSEPEEEAPG